MRPKEPRDSGQHDLLRSRLDQIIDTTHALAKLARTIDWASLSQQLGAVYSDDPGRPPLATRLMAGLAILKHMHNLSDETLCARWLENPYYQYFCGEEFFRHKLPFDRSSITRWRNRMGEEKLVTLLQESLAVATRTCAAKPTDFTRVIVDTTVQPKAVAFPTDAKLLARAHICAPTQQHVALRHLIPCRKIALLRHQRYAHANIQTANRALKTLRHSLQVSRDIRRRSRQCRLCGVCAEACLAERSMGSARDTWTKSLQPACTRVECIAAAHRPYDSRQSLVTTPIDAAGGQFVPSQPCRATLTTAIPWQRSFPKSPSRSALACNASSPMPDTAAITPPKIRG